MVERWRDGVVRTGSWRQSGFNIGRVIEGGGYEAVGNDGVEW